MFKKILIANRGEVAVRIIRTARRMGIRTVAVYSEADRDALHVEMADEAQPLGPPPAAQSYLSIDKIVAACRASGAEAVHPGYGFLSERPAFVTALDRAGIVFIGPNARAIEAMGDKIQSKRVARQAGVSTVPGSDEAIKDVAVAKAIAERVGYPVMIKASAGGGGKGMRIAHAPTELAEGIERAQSEARSAFGDDRVFIEKFVQNPRHIEIQVLGDQHGQVIHLGERECSIQRRNQKIVEESPSPLLDETTRSAMGAQAVALARAVNYDSAGTVEFVASQDKSFYFLEMNTRLQVEHPVTELVTGIDLVEQMIRVAAGEKLSLKQADIRLSGAAIETRIYAEDPFRGFLPSTGRLVRYREPAQSGGDVTVRIDSGVVEGGEISLYYDPMIGKLITHAPTREAAIDTQAAALDAFVIAGIEHNIPFLSALMQHPRFRAGKLSTGFIAEEYANGFRAEKPSGADARMLAAVAAALDHFGNARKRRISGQLRWKRVEFERQRLVRLGGETLRCELAEQNGLEVRFADGETLRMSGAWRPGEPSWSGSVDGRPVTVQVRALPNGVRLAWRGQVVDAHVYTGREAALVALMPEKKIADTGRWVRCPMPGLVVSIAVMEGQEVKRGETLAVVEAMKMENVLRAERDGRVKKIMVKPGDSLAVDAVILEFA